MSSPSGVGEHAAQASSGVGEYAAREIVTNAGAAWSAPASGISRRGGSQWGSVASTPHGDGGRETGFETAFILALKRRKLAGELGSPGL